MSSRRFFISLFPFVILFLVDVGSVKAEDQSSTFLNEEAYQKLKQGNYETAYQISVQALSQAKAENQPIEQARALSNLASNLSYLGDKEKALSLYSESLETSRQENDLFGTNRALNNIASIYYDLEDPDETLKYRQLQLENSLASNDIEDLLIAYIGLTQAYSLKLNLGDAKHYANLARQSLVNHPNPFLEIYVLLSESEIEEIQKDYDKAISLMNNAVFIAESNDFHGLTVSARANIVQYYLKQKKYAEAIRVGNETLVKAQEIKHQTKIIQLNKLLSEAYQAIGNFEQALHHYKKLKSVNERIIDEKVRLLGEVTKIERQVFEKEEQLIKMVKDQKILSLMLDKQKQNQLIWAAIASAVFILLFFIYYRLNSEKEIHRQKSLNKRLEELDVIKDRVLTNTSHELRTPLNGIIGLSEIIIKDEQSGLSEPTIHSLRLIKSSGEQLARVINDILELSKLKSNKLTIVNTRFNLNELINDVVAVCSPQANQKLLRVTYREIDNAVIAQDRGRLQQVLFNVIGNSVKFTENGDIDVVVDIKNGEIEIIVNDTGIGIPLEKQERIFEGFEQVDIGNNRRQSGSGLGLAISRGISEAIGGELTLTSTLGKGTSVKVLIPNISVS
ncbi:MAG: tetratricopeptide repeat-containing sensor histidine kinase [Kangiellaceae bacterium]|nr:tetratricopeptide repeat-containing sensor histidine kinase [Kangiellaceae bacterium]